MAIDRYLLKNIIEATLLVQAKPISINKLSELFDNNYENVSKTEIKDALTDLTADYEGRGIELVEVANGYRVQARQNMEPWLAKLFEEKPPRYSRALLETLVLVAYRQPITRSEIEAVRGVSVSSHIIKTLLEREWVRVVGHKEVPGRPAMYATTKEFLDYFGIKGIDELPSLSEIKDLDEIAASVILPEIENANNIEEEQHTHTSAIINSTKVESSPVAGLTAGLSTSTELNLPEFNDEVSKVPIGESMH